jgi:hypothetical protein
MKSEEFEQLIRQRPVLIRMIDGREFLIEPGQNVMVGDFTVGFLVKVDGVRRNAVVSLRNIASVTPATRP